MKLLPVAIIILILSVTIVIAGHVADVSLSPLEWAANTDKDVSLTVKNTNGDNIIKVELQVPESNQAPLYIIKEYGEPSGWKYETRTRDGQVKPYKIIWTSSSGIATGESKTFGFTVQSPVTAGEYKWTWKTTDTKDGTDTDSITTRISLPTVSYFIITVPKSTGAGESFKATVKAYGSDNQIKTDYTGTISFTSSDPKAILPSSYTFQLTDQGSKDFFITYKTIGNQSFTINDNSAKILQNSIPTKVNLAQITTIGITPSDSKAGIGATVTFTATAEDKYKNQLDITDKVLWSIDKEAKGTWTKNVYKIEKQGVWTVTASYSNALGATSLTVTSEVVQPKETNVTVKENVTVGTEIPGQIPQGQPTKKIEIQGEESLTLAPGTNETTIFTVNNVGNTDLKGVELKFTGVPKEWVTVYPTTTSIDAGKSKDYLIIVTLPENVSKDQTIGFVATSSEGVIAEKNLAIKVQTSPTGIALAVPKNVIQLGVVIIAVAAVIIIAWELWFKKPKKT